MPAIIKIGLVLLPLFVVCVAAPASTLDKITIPCEVMEVSKSFESSSSKLIGIRYILLHHAHIEDRETLSRWLKAHSGTEVTFVINGKEFKGILFRLGHCFGRGLLIYAADVSPEKRDIIKVILAPPP